ncbi:hypothetical protein CSC3H3_18635 [Thalassospira marina]|uniref:Uncharacterized protein n=1 Tax=Thalassospira marina TaxID=2048283 RepID=A0ABM6QD88_9PROT|nr:hypothetical protein CSC3H3_18635 [Thalassospira marina]
MAETKNHEVIVGCIGAVREPSILRVDATGKIAGAAWDISALGDMRRDGGAARPGKLVRDKGRERWGGGPGQESGGLGK